MEKIIRDYNNRQTSNIKQQTSNIKQYETATTKRTTSTDLVILKLTSISSLSRVPAEIYFDPRSHFHLPVIMSTASLCATGIVS